MAAASHPRAARGRRSTARADLSDVSVLIPARDEAAVIARTLAALRRQGERLEVIVVDDQSTDGTREICAALAAEPLERARRVASSRAVRCRAAGPASFGRSSKASRMCAARSRCCSTPTSSSARGRSPRCGAARKSGARRSCRCSPSCIASRWVEKLLTPAFVFFFKLLYPFALANDSRRRTAAAAGGCMLVRTADSALAWRLRRRSAAR